MIPSGLKVSNMIYWADFRTNIVFIRHASSSNELHDSFWVCCGQKCKGCQCKTHFDNGCHCIAISCISYTFSICLLVDMCFMKKSELRPGCGIELHVLSVWVKVSADGLVPKWCCRKAESQCAKTNHQRKWKNCQRKYKIWLQTRPLPTISQCFIQYYCIRCCRDKAIAAMCLTMINNHISRLSAIQYLTVIGIQGSNIFVSICTKTMQLYGASQH